MTISNIDSVFATSSQLYNISMLQLIIRQLYNNAFTLSSFPLTPTAFNPPMSCRIALAEYLLYKYYVLLYVLFVRPFHIDFLYRVQISASESYLCNDFFRYSAHNIWHGLCCSKLLDLLLQCDVPHPILPWQT